MTRRDTLKGHLVDGNGRLACVASIWDALGHEQQWHQYVLEEKERLDT